MKQPKVGILFLPFVYNHRYTLRTYVQLSLVFDLIMYASVDMLHLIFFLTLNHNPISTPILSAAVYFPLFGWLAGWLAGGIHFNPPGKTQKEEKERTRLFEVYEERERRD